MKMDRHHHDEPHDRGKQRFTRQWMACVGLLACVIGWNSPRHLIAQEPGEAAATTPPNQPDRQSNFTDDPAARTVLQQVLERLAYGAPFDCKVRQRIQTTGREVIGAGTGSYLQVGGGTSQFSFQMTLHDGVSQHALQQISDGRLAWTRREIAGDVRLSRVDVGWLDEGARLAAEVPRLRPSMLIGGPGEMLDVIARDYDLKLGTSTLGQQELYVVIGNLKTDKRDELRQMLGGRRWPAHLPTRVNIAIAKNDDLETNFGRGLPVRIEHWGDPVNSTEGTRNSESSLASGRQMISLLEFYSIKPINPPPVERFRFENQDAEIDFTNETARYEARFGIRVSSLESRPLR